MSSARTHLICIGAAALASATLLGAATGVAGAATPSGGAGPPNGPGNSGSSAVPATLDGIKAKANTDITDRVNDLNAAIAKVKATEGLGSGQATLVTYLGTDITPLQQLNEKIGGDATVKQAAEDFSTIFTGYRVYVLVLPASRIAADADRATTTAIPKLTADSSKAQEVVDPQNQGRLQPLIDDLNSQISAATSATDGLATTVLAATPAQWNMNNGLLSPSRSAVQTAGTALKKARSDVAQIHQVLDGTAAAATALRPLGTSTTTS